MASASKDETVIVWSMDRIKQNLNKMMSVDQTDFIITMIDDHEHVIDCIKFAPEQARKIIQSADYSKIKLTSDMNQTNNSGDPDESTGDRTRNDETDIHEESKTMDEGDSRMGEEKRMTTKEKVQKLKNDLKKRKAMLRGEIEAADQKEDNEEDDIKIDTSK